MKTFRMTVLLSVILSACALFFCRETYPCQAYIVEDHYHTLTRQIHTHSDIFNSIDTFLERGETDKAIQLLKDSKWPADELPLYYLLIGSLYTYQAQYGEALKYFDLVIFMHPENMEASNLKIDALSRLGKSDAVLEMYDFLIESDPNNTGKTMAKKAVYLMGRDRYDDAFDLAKDIELQGPLPMPEWDILAYGFESDSQYEMALYLYEKALDEGSSRAWFSVAKMNLMLGRGKEYLEYIESELEKPSEDPERTKQLEKIRSYLWSNLPYEDVVTYIE